ncbi:WhiB family transcriptional regulator [Kitasatospora sp. NPDC093102]|uniref:WhiB family transcriptional regulator n=1 Tax=Kitasatospora sp. NPDC093102 TaxID=3155069 RepID=UPI003420E874
MSTLPSPHGPAPSAESDRTALNLAREGACRFTDPELFFPPDAFAPTHPRVRAAKKICDGCPVARQCLELALRHKETHGIWGGMTSVERRHLMRRPGPRRATVPGRSVTGTRRTEPLRSVA